MFLADNNYYGGNPDVIWNAPISNVLTAYYYKSFLIDYQNVSIDLNKEK